MALNVNEWNASHARVIKTSVFKNVFKKVKTNDSDRPCERTLIKAFLEHALMGRARANFMRILKQGRRLAILDLRNVK